MTAAALDSQTQEDPEEKPASLPAVFKYWTLGTTSAPWLLTSSQLSILGCMCSSLGRTEWSTGRPICSAVWSLE